MEPRGIIKQENELVTPKWIMHRHDLPSGVNPKTYRIDGRKVTLPVAKSTWWQGVKEGRFPKAQKLGPHTTVWRVEDIRALFEDPKDG